MSGYPERGLYRAFAKMYGIPGEDHFPFCDPLLAVSANEGWC